MTRFGKILVFINLALGVTFATWAAGVYANRIDWGKAGTEKPGMAKGKLAEREEQFKEAMTQVQTSLARYNKALDGLVKAERRRPQLQKYYTSELTRLETGLDEKGQRVAAPVQELVFDKGVLRTDTNGRPLQRPIPWQRSQQLGDLARLGQEFDKTTEEIQKEKLVLDGLLAQEREQTEKLIGDGKVRKGLRRQMDEVQEALLNCLGEKEFLRRLEKAGINATVPASPGIEGEQEWLMPLLYNRMAELDLALQRQRRLEARLQELKGTTAQARQP